jgi:hypothetical protein
LEGTRNEEKKEQKKSMDFEDTDITYALVLLPSFSLSLSLSLSLILCHVIALEKIIAEGICAKTEFDKR